MAPSAIQEVVDKLTSKLFFHGHPINSTEARDEIGLHFVEAADEKTAEAMWNLFEIYQNDLKLEDQFDVKREAIAKNPLTVPPLMAVMQPQQQLPQVTVRLDPLQFAIIEEHGENRHIRSGM